MENQSPLVSVIIYNYNYGKYLRDCFDSVFNQTYPNIEILFSDNASTDDSWAIALEYSNRYPGEIFLAKNPKNYGAAANYRNCYTNIRGQYFVVLGSDDMLHQDFLSQTIRTLEANQDAGFAMTHRAIINELGDVVQEAPFYKHSCKIPPPLQSVVYMMASVNPSITQVIYRTDCALRIDTAGIGNRFHGARILDFNIACRYAVIYIKTPLIYHRIHGENDGKAATENLMDVIGPYVINFDFSDKALGLGLSAISEKLSFSIIKNAQLALRYAQNALIDNNAVLSKRYYHLAAALSCEIEQDSIYQELTLCWLDNARQASTILKWLDKHTHIGRVVSYDPPVGSLIFD